MDYMEKVNMHPVLIDAFEDEEIEDNFQDIRIELQSTGHNVTSVLMNPRETLMDSMFDEFASDQSAPLEYSNPPDGRAKGSSLPSTSRNGHMLNSSSSGSRHGGTIHTELTLTETEQLRRFIAKMKHIFDIYNTIHDNYRIRDELEEPTEAKDPRKSKRKVPTSIYQDLRNCYRDVPELYFRPTFNLKNQDMFNRALGSPTVTSMADKSCESNEDREVFQDKLSRYLDLIEMALLRQIWSQSPAFFRALDDIRALQYQFSDATANLKVIRSKLHDVSEAVSSTTRSIPKMDRELKNKTMLYEKLTVMHQILQARQAIMAQLEVEDYNTALELISIAKSLYDQNSMSELQSMKGVGAQLEDFDTLVGEVLCNKFVSIAIRWEEAGMRLDTGLLDTDLNSTSIPNVESDDNGNRGIPIPNGIKNGNGPMRGRESELRITLRHVLQSLLRTRRMLPALSMYKIRLLEAIKLITRTCVAEYLTNFDPTIGDFSTEGEFSTFNGTGTQTSVQSPGPGESTTSFGQKVREMPSETFLSCLNMCYEHVLVSLQKASFFHQFVTESVLELSRTSSTAAAAAAGIEADLGGNEADRIPSDGDGSNSGSCSASGGPDDIDGVIAISKSCLSSACDLSQRCISQLINLRKEVNSKMSLNNMKSVWEISLTFIASLDTLTGSTGYIMRQCLLVQTKMFLDYFHEASKGRLVNTLDSERWMQCDVTPERQRDIDKLSSGKAFLLKPQGRTSSSSSSSRGADGGLSSLTSSSNRTSTSSSTGLTKRSKDKDVKPVTIDGVEYKVVWSIMLVAEIVLSYLDVAFHFAPVTKDVISKVVEVLRLFNGRSQQLVLGAQARQSAARLKSISAKHLAITGQSLRLVISLMPHIRAALLAHIPPNQQLLLTELDRVSQELRDHHGQIMGMFVGIVSDFVDASAVKLRTFDWDRGYQNSSSQQSSSNDYFEEVLRNVSALHRVLLSTLPPEQVQDVFSRIFSLLNRKIPSHFDEIMPHTATGKQRILDEVSLLESALLKLKVVDTVSFTIEEIIRRKYCI